MEYIKIISERITKGGPTKQPEACGAHPRACGAPGKPPGPVFPYVIPFVLEKIKKCFGMKRRRLEAELGLEHFCSLEERFRLENFPLGGGNQSHHHHQRIPHHGRTNLHQHIH